MAIYTGYSDSADSHIANSNADYNIAHDAVTGGIHNVNSDSLNIGQVLGYGPTYIVYRGFVFFDTSSIPAGSHIINAVLSIKISNNASSQDFDIVIRNGQPTYPHSPLVEGDYLHSHYSGDGGSVSSYYISTDVYTDITLNATGRNWIQMGESALTKLALISSRDISETTPADPIPTEYIVINSADSSTYKPRLTILYEPPTTISVSTKNVSGVEGTYLTANGKINNGGGYTVSKRGFEWGLTKTNTWNTVDSGEFTLGDYSKMIMNLTEGTVYYIRAKITNTNDDVAYGEWVEISAGNKYGIYEECNTPTICFYLSEDDGKTWGQKHGPYTTDQADIEVISLLRMGSGKKKIKFETTALTGISAGVMVKADIKAR